MELERNIAVTGTFASNSTVNANSLAASLGDSVVITFKPTYRELIEIATEDCDTKLSTNKRWGMKKWLQAQDLELDDRVGDEFLSEFDVELKMVGESYLKSNNYGYANTIKTLVRGVQDEYRIRLGLEAKCIEDLKASDLPKIEPKRFTYADLIAYFEINEACALESQQIKNRRSALRQFISFVLQTEADEIGQELGGDEFLKLLPVFAKSGGKSNGSQDNCKSWMRQWAALYKKMALAESALLFSTLSDAVQHYLSLAIKNGVVRSHVEAAKFCGLSRSSLFQLIHTKRKYGTRQNSAAYGQLEVLLEAPPTTFTRFIPNVEGKLTEAWKSKRGVSKYGKKMGALLAERYRLSVLPDALVAEIKEFIRFKTDISVLPLERNQVWTTRPKSQWGRSEPEFQICSVDGETWSSSAYNFVTVMRSFFGALNKLGYCPSKFSLAYLTDFTLLKVYVDFMKKRLGSITETVVFPITLGSSLMFKKTVEGETMEFGFLLQQPEYADRLLNPIPRTKWREWCESQTKLIKRYEKDLKKGNHIKKGRDTEDAIRSILDRQHPITALLEIADNMHAYLNKHRLFMQPVQEMSMERDLLMFQMFPTQPLRINMYALMKYYPDNTGNLYQKPDGSWFVRFLVHDFKNFNGAAKDKDYNICLDPFLWPKIERFLSSVRPKFKDDRANVFPTVKFLGTKDQIKKILDGRGDLASLQTAVQKRSSQFLGDETGFCPHTVRHIVAHDCIKNHVDGYQMAADMLHDDIKTVKQHYGHVKTKDGHSHYGKYFDEVRNGWRTQA